MRSALGINRIAGTSINQVMQCTPTDMATLQTHLHRWGMPNFTSHSLLLRALTHPSISNWAERTQSLPRHSLSPHTLELLGDRIVGLSAATQLFNSAPTGASWLRALPALDAVLGNRGMAHVARRIGLQKLLRWEKARPPSLFRGRLAADGVDVLTGRLCNEQVNALAACYEAVAAAAYLDGGLEQAGAFVSTTLLSEVEEVRIANARVKDYAELLLDEMAVRARGALWFSAQDYEAGRAGGDGGRVGIELVDLETEHDNPAHPMFYAAVVVRKAGRAEVCEGGFLSFSSHFSKEGGRIAALTQAIGMLQGNGRARGKRRGGGDGGMGEMELRVGGKGDVVKVGMVEDRVWKFEGDYGHMENVLRGCGMRGEVSDGGREERGSGNLEAVSRRRRVGSTGRDGLEGLIDIRRLERCVIDTEGELEREYEALNCAVPKAEEVYSAVERELEDAVMENGEVEMRLVRGLHHIGHQSLRVWSVQRSMKNVRENRVELVRQVEERMMLKRRLERAMVGDGTGVMEDRKLSRLFVVLGSCVRRLGINATLMCVSGAEKVLHR